SGSPPNSASALARRHPSPPRSRKPSAATTGRSARPGQTKRSSAMTNGERPASIPWRAATKPSAQKKAAPTPHNRPHALAERGEGARSIQAREQRGSGAYGDGATVIAFRCAHVPRQPVAAEQEIGRAH